MSLAAILLSELINWLTPYLTDLFLKIYVYGTLCVFKCNPYPMDELAFVVTISLIECLLVIILIEDYSSPDF